MGNARRMAWALESASLRKPPERLVELGAGDGTFLLQVARRLSGRWRQVEAVVVDRWQLLAPRTVEAFHEVGWTVRAVQAEVFEWLDELSPSDPRAQRSRLDLQRVNAWMGNARWMARALESVSLRKPPERVVELGAGDGTFLLQVARRLSRRWRQVEAVLVDRWQLLAPRTAEAFHAIGWTVRAVQADVFERLANPQGEPCEVLVANLFLHHFPAEALRRLLQAAARRTGLFVACEPERSLTALTGARLLRLIGCNAVTRHDAVVSVRAGFRGGELSSLWPVGERWELSEAPAGWFGHLFKADRGGGGSRKHD